MSAYGAIKTVLEHACTTLGMRGEHARHLGAVVQLPGARNSRLDTPAADWARQVARAELAGGGVVRTGNLDVVRDFLDVRDVADAYLALLASPFEGVVNVGSGHATQLDELARLFVSSARVPLEIERDPALERSGDPPHVVADVELLQATTSWRPAWTLLQSVEDMLAEARQAPSGQPRQRPEAARCARS